MLDVRLGRLAILAFIEPVDHLVIPLSVADLGGCPIALCGDSKTA
jgi:hypothetical protein